MSINIFSYVMGKKWYLFSVLNNCMILDDSLTQRNNIHTEGLGKKTSSGIVHVHYYSTIREGGKIQSPTVAILFGEMSVWVI